MTKQEVLDVLLAVKKWWVPERYCKDHHFVDKDGRRIDFYQSGLFIAPNPSIVDKTCIVGAIYMCRQKGMKDQVVINTLLDSSKELLGCGITFANDHRGYDETIMVLDHTIKKLEKELSNGDGAVSP